MKFIVGLRVWVNGRLGKTPQVFPRIRGSANRRVDLHLPLIASIPPGGRSRSTLPGRALARAAKVVQDVAERTQSQGEVRGGDGALGQVGAELAAGVDTPGAADGVDLAEEEGDEPETGHPPATLGDQKH